MFYPVGCVKTSASGSGLFDWWQTIDAKIWHWSSAASVICNSDNSSFYVYSYYINVKYATMLNNEGRIVLLLMV